MKAKVMIETEIEVKEIEMKLAVRYEEEDIPNDFPGRKGDMLTLSVDVDTGEIADFPQDLDFDLNMKVRDQGTYRLYSPDGTMLKELVNEYVPHGVVPGEYGDYVWFKISNGKIENWPKHPNLKDFFPEGP